MSVLTSNKWNPVKTPTKVLDQHLTLEKARSQCQFKTLRLVRQMLNQGSRSAGDD